MCPPSDLTIAGASNPEDGTYSHLLDPDTDQKLHMHMQLVCYTQQFSTIVSESISMLTHWPNTHCQSISRTPIAATYS